MIVPCLAVTGSDVVISRLGFGCARIFGGSELGASARLIETALDAGIRHFDTAPSYGNGQSEAVLGAVLAGVPDVTITTKIGVPRPAYPGRPRPVQVLYRRLVRPMLSRFPETKARLLRIMDAGGNGPANQVLPRRKLSRDEVLSALEESLKQLRRDRVDLYLVHEPDQFELTDDLHELFTTLQSRETIGAFGLAWGRVADTERVFGGVVQGRYRSGLPATAAAGETRIFHGVIRHAIEGPDDRGNAMRAGVRIRDVLSTHRDSGVIFSASMPAQVRDIVAQCWDPNEAQV